MTKIIKTDSYTQDKALGLEEISAKPTATTDTGFVYTKDDGGDTELYYEDAAGTEVQITRDGALSVSADKLVNTPYEVALSNTDGSLTFTETGTFTTLGRLEMNSVHSIYIGSGAGTAVLAMDNIGLGTNVFSAVNSTDAETNVIIGNLAGCALTEGNSNCFYGHNSGSSVTSGDLNVLLGVSAGKSIATGLNNTIIGSHSGTNLITDSSSNVIIGAGAESTAAVAVDNVVAIGYEAAKANTADGTVAIGFEAGGSNTTGTGNTYLGYQAGSAISTSGGCTLIGYKAGTMATGADNTIVGDMAGDAFVAGSGNTLIGKSVGTALTLTSSQNTIVGNYAVSSSASDLDNVVVIGSSAATGVTANGTVAIGYAAGQFLTSGLYNTFIGYESGAGAGASPTTGANNTTLGYHSGYLLQGAGASNTLIGSEAGDAIATGSNNTILGYAAGGNVSAPSNAVYIGYEAGYGDNNNGNIAIGYQAGKSNSAANATYIGRKAGQARSGGTGSTAVGCNALHGTGAGSYNNAFGEEALYGCTSGMQNVGIGRHAGYTITDTHYSTLVGNYAGYSNNASGTTAVGYQAGYSNTSATGTVYVGYQAGLNATGANNTIIGSGAGDAASFSGTNNVAIGYNAMTTATGAANYNTVIGSTAGDAITTGDKNTLIGYGAGGVIATGSGNCALGQNALSGNTGSYNIAIGDNTLAAAGTGGYNIAIGSGAIYNGVITGTLNIAIGSEAGYSLTSASSSVFIGDSAGKYASTSSSSVCIGHNAAGSGVLTANGLVAIGYQAGYLVTSGAGNTIIGYEAGDALTTSTNNTIIGHQAGSAINTTANGNNSTLIGYQAGLAATGTDNILIGKGAGSSITTGDYNIIIGPITGVADAQRTFKVGYHASNEPILSGVMYDGAAGSGTDDSSELQTNVQLFKVRDPENDYEQFRAYEGKLSTYGEAAPDVDVGGFCQLMASGSDEAYSIKLTGLTHGLTSVMETDTFYKIKHSSSASPEIYAISTQTSAAQATTPALKFFGYARTSSEIKADNWLTGIRAVFEFDAAKHNGSNTSSALSDKEALFAVFNYKTPKFGITGNGNVYANAYSDVLDEEDDIKLVQSFSNPKTNPYYDRLKDLGVITGDMMCMNKMNMLSIGAIGQLFNVIRGLAKRLGVSEDELYDLAKQY